MNILPSASSSGPLLGSVFLLALLMSGLSLSLTLNLQQAQPKIDWIEYGFLVFMLGTALALWLGLILASLGWFTLERLSAALAVVAIVGWLITRRSGATLRPVRSSRIDAALIGLLALLSVFYFRPHEFVLGAADAGVYVNMGAQIARSGSLLIDDSAIARLEPSVYPAFFREQQPGTLSRYYYLPGYYLSDTQPGLIIPQFFALQAVSIGILTAIGGVSLGLYATPIWGLLGVAALYFFARGLFGRRAALLSAILLGLTATQIWFARYPTAEVLTQALLFFGLYALTRMLTHDAATIGWGLLAGLWLGLIFLARIDMILVAVVLFAMLVALALLRRWHSGLTAFAITLGLMSVHSMVHALLLAWPYTWNTYSAVFKIFLGNRLPLWIAAGALALLGMIVGWRVIRRISPEQRSRTARLIRIGLIALVVIAALYAYFIRPRIESAQPYVNWYDGTNITQSNSENLLRIGWYVTPLGLAMGLIGLTTMIWRERSIAVGVFVAVGLLSTTVYVINILNNPQQIYAMRRYVPIVIPAIVIWGAYGLVTASRIRDRRVFGVVGIIVIGWVGGVVWQSRVIGLQVDNTGTLSALTEIDRGLGSGVVVLMDDQSAVGLGDILGTPLRFIFDHPVFVLRAPNTISLPVVVGEWQQQGYRVDVINDAAKGSEMIKALPIVDETHFTFETSVLAPTYTDFPDRVIQAQYDLKIFTIGPVSSHGSFLDRLTGQPR